MQQTAKLDSLMNNSLQFTILPISAFEILCYDIHKHATVCYDSKHYYEQRWHTKHGHPVPRPETQQVDLYKKPARRTTEISLVQ